MESCIKPVSGLLPITITKTLNLIYSQDSFIVRLRNERNSFIARQLSTRLVFRASSGLVVAPTTVFYEVCPESIGPTFISPRCFHFSKQSWNSLLGIALSTLVALFPTVVLSSNRCPLSGFLSFGNSQKSQGAMSGLYGGFRSNAILFLLRNCCTRFDECASALSW